MEKYTSRVIYIKPSVVHVSVKTFWISAIVFFSQLLSKTITFSALSTQHFDLERYMNPMTSLDVPKIHRFRATLQWNAHAHFTTIWSSNSNHSSILESRISSLIKLSKLWWGRSYIVLKSCMDHLNFPIHHHKFCNINHD